MLKTTWLDFKVETKILVKDLLLDVQLQIMKLCMIKILLRTHIDQKFIKHIFSKETILLILLVIM